MTDQSWVQNVPSRKLWRIFAPAVVKDLAKLPGGKIAGSLLCELLTTYRGSRSSRISEVYESAFLHLAKNQPAEYFYKNAVLQRSVLSKHGSKRSRAFFEFRAGKSKLDALIASDSLHAFEIKTELDHYRRLPTQIAEYQKRFAHVWVLSSEKQAATLEKQMPRDVGVAFMSGVRRFEIVRQAPRNTRLLESAAILECLRRNEYLDVVRDFGFNEVGVPNTLVFREAMRFAQDLDPEKIQEATLKRLKLRPNALSMSALSRIPLCIRAAAVASHLGDDDVDVLLGALASRVIKRRGE